MGKKGKGNKLAKMSEEERARYLQLRADIEEEARRRKVQLISLYMKNKLKREDAFSRLNMAKINQEWRSILRQIKCEELQKEINAIEKCCREALERKEETIQRLLNDLDVAEDMYATLEQAHLESVNKLIGLQQERIEFFKQTYENNKKAILAEYQEDHDDFKEAREGAQVELECVMYQLEDRNEKQLEEQHERFLEKMDDIRSEAQARLEEITGNGEKKLEQLWQEYQDALNEYVKYTEGFYAEYMDLKERDEEYTTITREHCNEIEKATDQLAHLKLLYANTEENNEMKVCYLEKTREDLRARMAELKANFEVEMREDEERFKVMSVESHHAIKSMEGIVKKGETLMQLGAACRKYETEQEKLLPLGLPPITKYMFDKTEEEMKQPPEELKGEYLENWQNMENFWRCVNNVNIDVVCLKKRRKTLEEENADLKAKLQEHLINLNISNGSNLHVNDYLSKRPSSMQVQRVSNFGLEEKKPSAHSAEKCTRRRPVTTYVEANLTNAVRSQALAKGKLKLAKIETLINGQVRRY